MENRNLMDERDDISDDVGYQKNIRLDRRTFMKLTGLGVGAIALSGMANKLASASQQVLQTPLPGKNILKYVDPLPVFGPGGVSRVSGSPITVSMTPHMQQVISTGTLNPAGLPIGPTAVWAYNVNGITNYPAVSIEQTRGTPTQVIYNNNLTKNLYQLLTVDQSIHWANPLNAPMMVMGPAGAMIGNPAFYTGEVPAVVHLHGGEVPPQFDGGPDAWWTPLMAQKGHGFVSNIYDYPNKQEATTLWFHDHTLGATRLNVFAGLAGFYLLRDKFDTGVPATGLNLPAGQYEREIAIQDRMFDTGGQWFFPDIGINPMMHPYWIPEFFGDAIVVNGKTWPYLNVEPRRYRFRLLNGSNARFYNLTLPIGQGKNNFLPFYVIGTDGGLLDRPVMVNQLLLAPGERADVIIDFSAPAAIGQIITVSNDAKAPYPGGRPPDPATVAQIMQFRVVLPIQGMDTSFNPAALGATLRSPPPQPPLPQTQPAPVVRLVDPVTGNPAPGVTISKIRRLTLNEVMGKGGPLEILVNNTKWSGFWPPAQMGGAGQIRIPPGSVTTDFTKVTIGGIDSYYSELPQEGQIEMWEIVNLTRDTHPIHLHLVQFQLRDRQSFNKTQYLSAYSAAFMGGTFNGIVYAPGVFIPEYGPPMNYNIPVPPTGLTSAVGGNPDVTPFLQGAPLPPKPEEAGWKDTVQMNPGEVARILVRYAPTDKALTDPNLYYPFNPNGGHGYVWHCHIVDHEDNEMMRPYAVTPLSTVNGPIVGISMNPPPVLNTLITFTGTVTPAPDLAYTPLAWSVYSGATPTGTPLATGTGPTFQWTPTIAGTYTIVAATTDSRGKPGSASVVITV